MFISISYTKKHFILHIYFSLNLALKQSLHFTARAQWGTTTHRKRERTCLWCYRGPRFDPRSRRGKFRSPNTLSLVSFAGMTLDKCIVLRIGTLTGCPLCRESHPMCRLKNPTVISIWLLVGFYPATRSVQCTPADNARK